MNSIAKFDFHVTARCSQACPYCWGPRRFRKPIDTTAAQQVIDRIQKLGARRIVFTGGDPLQREDTHDLIRYAKGIGLETALSTTGDCLSPALLADLAPVLDLVSLPLDGATEDVNARTKHLGHFAAVMQALEWLRDHPAIDVKVCTPVTRHNLHDVGNIADLVEAYARTTTAAVFYNVFQAFPRAMFTVKWEKLLVTDEEFAALTAQVNQRPHVRVNFLSHATLDKLYAMVFPNGNLIIPRGADYLNFGPLLAVENFEDALAASAFDSAKHLHHSRGWGKAARTEVEPPLPCHPSSGGYAYISLKGVI
jgi:MoaA/NifB/PqqE/SkfB family radical SAM enzyme